MTCVVVQFQKRKKKNQSTLTATKLWCSIAPEDKKQKENETPEVYTEFESSIFSGLMLAIQMMMVHV